MPSLDLAHLQAPISTPSPGGTIEVLVIDDHLVFTELLSLALDTTPETRCVAVATTLRDGLRAAAAHEVDVIVIDVRLPDGNGLDAITPLLALRPRARVVVLTGHPRSDLASRAMNEGASAFLAKEEGLARLLEAIRVARPNRPLVTEALPEAAHAEVGLTPREREVLQLMVAGQDPAGMARTLGLSRHTVRDHIKAVLAKLEVHSQLAAVSRAVSLGIVDPWTS